MTLSDQIAEVMTAQEECTSQSRFMHEVGPLKLLPHQYPISLSGAANC